MNRPHGDWRTPLQLWKSARERLPGAPGALRDAAQRWRLRRAQEAGARAQRLSQRVAGLPVWCWLLGSVLGAIALRLYYWNIKAGMHYPDEIFQYLEPAHWQMHGDAWMAWEFKRGARNWLLPWHYGSLMSLGEAFGLRGWGLHRALMLHNCLFATLIVPAAYRLGLATGRGDQRLGVMTALMVSLFPLLGYFSPHTLSEIHSLVFATWAYALWMEHVVDPERFGRYRRPFLIGLLLGGILISRTSLLILVPWPLIDYNLRARFREFFAGCAGLLLALFLLAYSDKVMWGESFHSILEYIKFNWVEKGAERLEVKDTWFYWDTLFVQRLGFARYLLIAPMLLFFWRHWRSLFIAVLTFAIFSKIGIKQERFLTTIWPFVIVAASSGAIALFDLLSRRLPERHRQPLVASLCGGFVLAVCLLNFQGTAEMPMRWKAGVFQAQSWVGEQDDATGLIVEDRVHMNGGHFLLHKSIPQTGWNGGLLHKPIFNYVIVYSDKKIAQMARRKNFEEVQRIDDVEDAVIFRRREGLFSPSATVPDSDLRWRAGASQGRQSKIACAGGFSGIDLQRDPKKPWLRALRPHCTRAAKTSPQRWLGPLQKDAKHAPSHCKPGALLVGLRGRAGSLVDAAGAICAEGLRGKRIDAEIIGGSGGAPFRIECPPAQRITELLVTGSANPPALGSVGFKCGAP